MKEMENEKNKFLKGIVGFSLVTWIGFGISLLSFPIVTRIFVPEQLGRINLFHIKMNLLVAVALLGLDQAFVRFYYEPPSKTTKKYLMSFVTLTSTVTTVVIGLIMVLFFWRQVSYSIVENYNQIIVICLAVSAISTIVLRYLNLLYRMEQKMLWFNIQGILIIVVARLSYVVTGIWYATYMPAIITLTVTSFLLMLFFLFYQKKNFDRRMQLPDKNFVKEIGTFAAPLIPLKIIGWVNTSVSALIISNLLDFAGVALFTVATGLAGTINIIQAGFNTYWAPYVYQNYKDNSHRFWTVHKLIACCLTFFGLLIILLQEVAFILIGPDYRGAMLFFPFLLVAPICYTLGETTGMGIGIAKKTYWSPIILTLSILVNVVICYLLIPELGVPGAAIASATAGVVSVVLKTVIGGRYFKSIKNNKYVLLTIALLILASVTSFIFEGNRPIKYTFIMVIVVSSIILFREEALILAKQLKYIGNVILKKICKKRT